MSNEELIIKVSKLLKSYKLRYRRLYVDDDKLYIGAEDRKENHTDLIKQLKKLRLHPSNLVYGRWVFYIK